jgi:ubiquinone/menaquinone biosynthesis C-methylase UbiE
VDHADHVALIRGGVPGPGGRWADLGSGAGAFTLALADLVGPTGSIVSVDRDSNALREQARALVARSPAVSVQQVVADFTRPLDLTDLDGVVMANSLHFVAPREQAAVLRLVAGYLRPAGRLILVEYDADRGNPWVPHPISSARWPAVAATAGFGSTRILHRVPSRFLGAIYSAVSERLT